MEMPGKAKKTSYKPAATMLDLTTQHIDQIRNYFIATSDEEKRSLQNSIAPMFLKGFLNDLKVLFIYEPENETKLISIAKSMGASKHIEALKEIQQQFYSQLGEIYLNGETNHDIEELLKVHNQRFLNEVSFQSDLQSSFILNDRESLKKKFGELDKAYDISSSEMEDAFKHIERERFKEHFEEIDFEEYQLAGMVNNMVTKTSLANEGEAISNKAEEKVKRLNWKRLAIAASVVGLVLISTILIINNNKSANEIAKNDNKNGAIVNKVDSNLPNKDSENKANELLADNKLKYKEIQMPVLKEQSLGFSAKEEKITIRFFDAKERIAELEKSTNSLMRDGKDSESKGIKNQIDSLQSLNNKYTFDGKTITLYMPNAIKVESFKLTDKYFIKIDGNVYHIIKSLKPTVINKVTDKNILEKIDEIDFKQNN